MTKILLLDVMGTLVTEPYMEVLPKFFGMSLKEVFSRRDLHSWPAFERNEISEEDYFRESFKNINPDLDGKKLKQMMYDYYQIIDGIEPLLKELQERSIPMYALSNYPTWYEMIEEKLKLSRYLEWKFVSCQTGVRKPDPRSYTGPAETLGVSTSDCIFVDDRKINCEAARETGMVAIEFSNAEKLRAELMAFGVL